MGRTNQRALLGACTVALCALAAWALLRTWASPPQRGVITGTVRASGQPIASVNVCAACATCSSGDALTCSRTDRAGRYALTQLEPGYYRLSAAAGGYVASAMRGGELVRIEPGAFVHLEDLALAEGGARVRGTIRGPSGAPLAGARARIVRPERPRLLLELTADARGAFEVAMPNGPFEVRASAAGHAPATLYGVAPSAEANLTLRPAVPLRGRVVHADDGEPIAAAIVRAISHEAAPRVATVRSDASGAFELADLAAGSYLITASGASAYGELAGVELGAGDSSVVVEAHRAFALRGRVQLEGGGPCPEGYVLLGEPDPARPVSAEIEALAVSAQRRIGPEQHATIGRDGLVQFPGVPAGAYFAAPQCVGYALASGPELIELPRDAGRELVWTMTPATHLVARAVDRRGSPVAGARIAFSWPGRGGRRVISPAVTGDDGRAELQGPACGDCRVMAADNLDASRALPFALTPDRRSGQATLTLDGDATLELEVRDPRGAPVDRLTVFARELGAERDKRVATALGEGRYRIPALPSGSYVVFVDGGPGGAQPLWGSEGMPIRVDDGASLRERRTLHPFEQSSNVLHLTGEVSIKEMMQHD